MSTRLSLRAAQDIGGGHRHDPSVRPPAPTSGSLPPLGPGGNGAARGRQRTSELPSILPIWVDDTGQNKLRCSDNVVAYRTPNLDRMAAEAARFTDHDGEQSCAAGAPIDFGSI